MTSTTITIQLDTYTDLIEKNKELENKLSILIEAIKSDASKFYNNESAAQYHLNDTCGSGHCGFCSEAPHPYAKTSEILNSVNTPERGKTGGEKWLAKKMQDPSFASEFKKAKEEVKLKDETKNVPIGTPFDEESTTNPDKR